MQYGFGGGRARYGWTTTALPGWMRPPRAEGWFAEDLDHVEAAGGGPRRQQAEHQPGEDIGDVQLPR